MQSRVVKTRRLGLVTVRPLRDGDTATVAALFDRLGSDSRARRFLGPKPVLSAADLALLAAVNARSHALVAYAAGDPCPAGLAQLVRREHRRTCAEIAFAVADRYQGHGIGTALVELLAADARAAGVTHLTATLQSSNAAAHALVRKVVEVVEVRHEAGEATIVGGLAAA